MPIVSNETESVMRSLLKKNPGLDGLAAEFYQALQADLLPILFFKLLKKKKKKKNPSKLI